MVLWMWPISRLGFLYELASLSFRVGRKDAQVFITKL